jgi:hypothetical protein
VLTGTVNDLSEYKATAIITATKSFVQTGLRLTEAEIIISELTVVSTKILDPDD